MKPQNASGLKGKSARFVLEYLIDLNATQAAIRAGYSPKTARSPGHRLLTNVAIAEAIRTASLARSKRMKTDADWVLARLRMEADADLADIYEPDGSIMSLDKMPPIWRTGLIASIEVEEIWEGVGENRKLVGRKSRVRISDRFSRLLAIGNHVSINAFRDTDRVGRSYHLNTALEAMVREATVFSPKKD